MDGYMIFWIAMLVLAAGIEIATQNLVSIWFCGGAIAALVMTSLGLTLPWQATAFVVVTALLLICTRPFVKKISVRKLIPTNADRNIGETTTALQDITDLSGQIKVGGKEWTAITYNGTIPKGELVTVVEIKGVRAIVERARVAKTPVAAK